MYKLLERKVFPMYILMFVVTLIQSLVVFISPYINQKIIDEGLIGKNYSALIIFIIISVAIFIFSLTVNILGSILSFKLNSRLNLMGVTKYLNKIYSVKFRNIEDLDHGAVVSHLANEIPSISNYIVETLPNLVANIIKFIIVCMIIVKLNWVLLLVVSLLVPVYVLIVNKYGVISKENNSRMMEYNYSIKNKLLDNLKTIKLTYFFNSIEYFKTKFVNKYDDVLKYGYYMTKVDIFYRSVLSILFYFPTVLILLIGGKYVIEGRLTLGEYIAYTTYMSMFFDPIENMTSFYMAYQKYKLNLEKIDVVYKLPEYEKKSNDMKKVNRIEISNLSFSYKDDRCIINNLSANFEIGKINKVKGGNGSGKSTLVLLILGFLEKDNGGINFINENRVETLNNADIGIVPQNFYFINDSIRENIRFGRNISDEEIFKLAKQVGFDDFISEESEILDNVVNALNDNFSGGERQKIAILRALVTKPNLLIIDEYTNHLDINAKKTVQSYIKKIKDECLIIEISHEEEAHAEQMIIDIN